MTRGNKFACLAYHAIGGGDGRYTVREKELRAHRQCKEQKVTSWKASNS